MSALRGRLALAGLSAWLAAQGACGRAFEADQEIVANRCSGDGDCAGGTCKNVDNRSVCVALEADLAGVIFQLDGATTAGQTVSHVFSEGISIQGRSDGGAIKTVALDVPQPFILAGRFLQPGGPVPFCTEADGSVPVKVEARPYKELAGLNQVFTGTSRSIGGSHQFRVEVPAGRYDVYIVPQPFTGLGCETLPVAPPAIFRDIDVDPDVLLEPEVAEPKRLRGLVKVGDEGDLEGYVVELVDAERGLSVSEKSPLGGAVDGEIPILGGPDGKNEGGVAYYAPAGARLVLRLSDPAGALVVHWDFEALDIDGDGVVVCDLRDLIDKRKALEATVIDQQNRPVPGATVTIKSVSLTGTASKNASFRVTTTSGADGKIHVELFPGDYQVLVAPSEQGGPTVLDDTWEVQPDALCCGKSFLLTSRSIITARVTTALDDPAAGVAVLASPALRTARTYFETAVEALEILPRQSSSTTDATGAFAVPVDAGLYDVTLRTEATSGFPWLVLPSVVVAPVDQQPASTLEDVLVPLPALFVGRASAQGVDVTGATLRAYLPLAGSETSDTSPVRVVQIGETIVGAGGMFVLPVPPTVARVVPEPAGTSASSALSSSAAGAFQD